MKFLNWAIKKRAYALYKKRGSVPGYEADDWFTAEGQIRRIIFYCNLFLSIVLGIYLFNKYLIEHPLQIFFFMFLSFSIVLVWLIWKPEKFSNFLSAATTIIIALATLEQVNVSNKLAGLETINIEHNQTALQVEFRPYVVLELQDSNKIFMVRSESTHIQPTIESINVGKVPALNFQINYQAFQTQPFELPANDIPPGGGYHYYPDINIGNPQNYEKKNLNVVLRAKYSGNHKVDKTQYCTELYLTFEKAKTETGYGFKLKNHGSIFGFEEKGLCVSQATQHDFLARETGKNKGALP